MKTFFKLLGVIIFLLLIIVIIGGMYLNHYVNSKDFTQVIEKSFHDKTGRDLQIGAPLKVSFFPWMGVKLSEVSISNAKGFDPKYFAKIKTASVQVRLWPLFHGNLQLGKALLDGLSLNLTRNAYGKNNWQDLFATAVTHDNVAKANKPTLTNKSQQATQPVQDNVHIAGIAITHANVEWSDQLQKQSVSLRDLNFSSDNLSPTKPFPINLSFDLAIAKPELTTHVDLRSEFAHDSQWGSAQLRHIVLKSVWQHQQHTFNFMLNGNIGKDLRKPQSPITFNLQSDELNIDKLLAILPQTNSQTSTAAKPQSPVTAKPTNSNYAQQLKTIKLPAALLKLINLDGQLQVKHLVVKAIHLHDVTIPVKLDNGKLQLNPVKANLLKGSYVGNLQANAVDDQTISFSFNNQLRGVEIGEVVQFHDNALGITKVTGTGNVTSQLNGRGQTAYDVLRGLNGNLQVKLANGALQGIDIPYQLQRIVNLATRSQADNVKQTNQTPFLDLTINSQIKQGVTQNQLAINTPVIRGEGQGNLDLVSQALNFNLTGYLLTAKSHSKTLRDISSLPLSVKMTGTLQHHQFQPDLSKIAQYFLKQNRDKLVNEVSKHLDKSIGNFLNNHF